MEYLGYDESSKVIGFNAFRNKPAPTSYGPNKTAVSYDITLAGLICAAVIIFITYLIILPGIRGIQRLWTFIRMTISLFIGLSILLCLQGVDWENGYVTVSHIAYKPFTRGEVSAKIGLHIGLREINITLKGEPIEQMVEANQTETINYNEQYRFCCGQGRTGFGPYAGRINQEFRATQWRGSPLPIQWVLEYFTLDGDNIRWGRIYRLSGWYTNILMWTSFPLWLLSNMLLLMVIHYGAYILLLTGGCMLTANIIFATLRNSMGGEKDYFWLPLEIPLGDETLTLSYGWCFWMNLSAGLLCVVLAFMIYILNDIYPLQTAKFFNVDPLQDFHDKIVQVGRQENVYFQAGNTNDEIEPTVDLGSEPIYENRLVFRPKRKTLFGRHSKPPKSTPRGGKHNNGLDTHEEVIVNDEYVNIDGLQGDGIQLTVTSSM
ncbi:dual oxidase maturation factor 1-like [Antedon mediterranea]|uniref:dual oxidase maturation factor 1-like n=1 Tax=Antedon mediterranea TaxID=105859 RepID=UPI003AF875DF